MLEKIGDKDIVVRNYTDNFNVKEFIQDELVPKAFPNIPMNKLNLGFTGVISEYISQAIEDSSGTAELMLNESFINKAILPSSIYAEAAKYGLSYSYAVPSKCNFALEISLSDVIKHSEAVKNTTIYRYILDKDTRIVLGDYTYKLDYDVFIDHQFVDNRRVFNIYYDDSETNSIANIKSKYIKYQVTTTDWLILFIELKEFNRITDTEIITDNLLTTNTDIELTWEDQLAGIDCTYITPSGQRLPLTLKAQFTRPDTNPFVWFKFEDDNLMKLSFSSVDGYWSPEFNSSVEYTIYTTNGAAANFTSYDRNTGIPVKTTGERFSYNEDTKMIAICYSGSINGIDKGDIEVLRDEVILAANSINVLNTDKDLDTWFNNYAKRYNTISKFFKRRDDPSGTLFSQFIAIKNGTYIYPTNTLNIVVEQDQFDYVNSNASGMNEEFIIKPGHLWQYNDNNYQSRMNVFSYIEKTEFFVVDNEAYVTYPEDQVEEYKLRYEIDTNGDFIVYAPDEVEWFEPELENFYIDEDGDLIFSYDIDKYQISLSDLVMVKSGDGYAMITDDYIPSLDDTDRKFMFVNPFFIKINREHSMLMNYNYLINHTSWPEAINVSTNCTYQFQMAQFSIERSLNNTYNNMYHIEAVVVPVINDNITYINGIGSEFSKEDNNLRLVLITRDLLDGETGYIEMDPAEVRESGAVLFSTNIAVYDNITSDDMIEIDMDRTSGIKSLINDGPRIGKVFIDSNETNFHFAIMMKEPTNSSCGLYGNTSFDEYVMANRFQNDYRDLTLYKPMNMMRSMVSFSGTNDDYTISASLISFLRYDIPLDNEKMEYFIQAFADQYDAMEPVLSRLDGNTFLDFKLYNTYGRSTNYYIGPEDGVETLKDSTILLDDVHVRVNLVLSVYDRSLFTQTSEDVVNKVIETFQSLDTDKNTDLYVSDIIRDIIDGIPNVRYVRFLGFNDYDANKQSIFVKYSDISELNEELLQIRVPEIIRVDSESIKITEEV